MKGENAINISTKYKKAVQSIRFVRIIIIAIDIMRGNKNSLVYGGKTNSKPIKAKIIRKLAKNRSCVILVIQPPYYNN